MNERIVKERGRNAWLITAGAVILILVVAGLLWRDWPETGLEETGVGGEEPSIAAVASRGLPTPISGEALPTPLTLGLSPQPDEVSMTAVAVGQTAPNFTLPTLDGGELTLSDLRGRPVILNFWASWCSPCRLEMPALVAAHERHQFEGLEIVALNVTSQDTLPEARAFVEEFALPFPVVLDEAGHVTADDYRLRGLPMSILIDRTGVVKRIQLGAMTEGQIAEFIGELLATQSN